MFAERTSSRRARPGGQRGVTIVELMVGIVVSMLVGLAAVSTTLSFNAAQRQSVNTGGTAANIITALNAIKAEISPAGLGFYQDGTYICEKMNLSTGATVLYNDAAFSPLIGTTEVQANFDRLEAIFATDVAAGARVYLEGSVTSTSTKAYLSTWADIPAGGGARALLLSADPSAVGGTRPTCTIRTATGMTPPDALLNQPMSIDMSASGAYNQANFANVATYAPLVSRMSVLGDINWRRFSVIDASTNGAVTTATKLANLEVRRPLKNDGAVLLRDVVAFKFQYGLSTDTTSANTSITQWVSPTGTWATIDGPDEIGRIRAIRVGIVTRAERPRTKGAAACTASTADLWVTPTRPVLFRDASKITVTPPETDWQCYRYRQAEMLIPMRNIVLGRASTIPTPP